MSFFLLLFTIPFFKVSSVMAAAGSADESAPYTRTGPAHLVIQEEEEVLRYLNPSSHVEKTLGIDQSFISPEIGPNSFSLSRHESEDTENAIYGAFGSSLYTLGIYDIAPNMKRGFVPFLNEGLPSCLNLRVLDLRGCGLIAHATKQLIKILPSSLQVLQLEGNSLSQMDDEDLLPQGLQILNLYNTDLTDTSAISLLNHLPAGLLKLDMRGNPHLTDQGWAKAIGLLERSHLTHLALGGRPTDQKSMESYAALAKTLESLIRLKVFYLESFGPESAEMDPLLLPRSLESLTIRNIPLSEKWGSYFKDRFRAPRLKYICITSAGPAFSLPANFSNFNFLQVLDLSFNRLRPGNITFLFNTLPPRIRYINMQGAQMTAPVVRQLIQHLKQSPTPFTANLSGPYPFEAIKHLLPGGGIAIEEEHVNILFRPNQKIEEPLYGASLGPVKPVVAPAIKPGARATGFYLPPLSEEPSGTTPHPAVRSAATVLSSTPAPLDHIFTPTPPPAAPILSSESAFPQRSNTSSASFVDSSLSEEIRRIWDDEATTFSHPEDLDPAVSAAPFYPNTEQTHSTPPGLGTSPSSQTPSAQTTGFYGPVPPVLAHQQALRTAAYHQGLGDHQAAAYFQNQAAALEAGPYGVTPPAHPAHVPGVQAAMPPPGFMATHPHHQGGSSAPPWPKTRRGGRAGAHVKAGQS